MPLDSQLHRSLPGDLARCPLPALCGAVPGCVAATQACGHAVVPHLDLGPIPSGSCPIWMAHPPAPPGMGHLRP